MARRNRNTRSRSPAPGWVWMLFGLSLGLVVAVGVYLRLPVAPSREPPAPPQSSASAQPSRTSPPARERAAVTTTPAENQRFEFYEILPQIEVVVPDDPAPTARQRRAAAEPGSFLLQTGSFGTAADADRHQASLALLGFESHVQRVTIDAAVFHRVRIGPIDDADAAKRTQRRLREAGIDSLLMQVPK